ncbi:MAG: low molecular weight protein-tyrosine-phosphatase [Bacteroidota bacterium]
MTRILFVCLGNICRSPLAEAVFNHQAEKKKVRSKFYAASCGTANYHVGDPPDLRTIKNALKNGVTIDHVGRQFNHSDFEEFDLILAMDKSNQANILRVPGADKFANKVKLMRSFDPVDPGSDVPDPYYGTERDFQEVFDILDRSVRKLIESFEEDA